MNFHISCGKAKGQQPIGENIRIYVLQLARQG